MQFRVWFTAVRVLLLLGIFSYPVKAQLSVAFDPDAITFDLSDPASGPISLADNDFISYFTQNGFSYGGTNATLSTSGAGSFTFEIIGSDQQESEYEGFSFFGLPDRIEAFTFGSTNFIGADGVSGSLRGDGLTVLEAGPISQTSLQFASQRNPPSLGLIETIDSMDSTGFAVFVPSAERTSNLSSLYFAYEADDGLIDYDDLIIRATFELDSVPEPSVFLLFMLGLGYIVYRQRQRLVKNKASKI